MSVINRLNFGSALRTAAVMFTGGGSGLWEPQQLGNQQRARSQTLQDTRRSYDQITWRREMAYARQLYTAEGTVRGPVHEKSTLANSGNWLPRSIGTRTPKPIRNLYEEWAWNWMKSADLRNQPYDFWTDMDLASIMLDRDGEYCWIPTRDSAGNPRLQMIAPHRIYSHTSVFKVADQTLPDGRPNPYYGMKINNGVIYDDNSTPVAYFVLDESLQFSMSLKGQYIPVQNMQVMYKPDWCDQGRGITAFAHAIRDLFDLNDTKDYTKIALKRNSVLPIIRSSVKGTVDKGAKYVTGGVSDGGTPIALVEGQGGEYWDVTVDSKSDIKIPESSSPSPNALEFNENVLMSVYQGLEWPYEYARQSKESRGANIRVTVEKINRTVAKQFGVLEKIAIRKVGYALGTAVARGELPPGEWYALDFPSPPEMTPDKYHEMQEAREDYKMGFGTIQNTLARRGYHWRDDIREQRDEDMRDKFDRVRQLASEYTELTFKEVLDLYEQRSPNMVRAVEGDPNTPGKKPGAADGEE